jgi:hypothetical protein
MNPQSGNITDGRKYILYTPRGPKCFKHNRLMYVEDDMFLPGPTTIHRDVFLEKHLYDQNSLYIFLLNL